MLYSNPEFFLLFSLTWLVYVLSPSYRVRFSVLLAASGIFYAWAGLFDCLIFLFVVFISWSAVALARRFPRQKRPLIWSGVGVMTLHLLFWKYGPWICGQIQLVDPDFHGGLELRLPLPVGISFFTLQGIAYLADFANSEAKYMDLPMYVLFKSFFAQLIAGPIVRARQLLPQLDKLERPAVEDVAIGIGLFVQGFVKKLLVADRIGPFVDNVFKNPEIFGRRTLALALIGYTVQIWADFSGYTDMGRGAARMLGIRLPENFLCPYFSRTPSEFWRRWHVTLSEWIRDYIYIPLGGSRGTPLRVLFVVMLTMTVSGFWHGAQWHFAAWGLYHGALLVGERQWRKLFRSGYRDSIFLTAAAWGVTLVLTMVGWLIFRATDFPSLVAFARGLLFGEGRLPPPPHGANVLTGIVFCAVMHLLWYKNLETDRGMFENISNSILRTIDKSSRGRRFGYGAAAGAALAFLFLLALLFRMPDSKAFIYFQF